MASYTYCNVLIILILLLLVVILIVYTLFKYSYTYWKRKGVKGPKPTFPGGNFPGVLTKKKHISDPIERLYEQYKSEPFIGVYFLYKPVLIINDLDLIKHILIKDFDHFDSHGSLENEQIDPLSINLFNLSGERWRRMRQKLSPVFTSGKIKMMTEVMIHVQGRLVTYIDKRIKTDSIVDVKEILGFYAMDIIGNCAFGIECDSFTDPRSKFIHYGKESAKPSSLKTQITFMLSFIAPALLECLRISAQSPDVIQFYKQLVEETVRYREQNNLKRNDFFQTLIELKNNQFQTNSHGESPFTLVDLAAQTFLFVLGGYETSSSTASYALYWLARRPELQRRARQEVRAVLARYNGRFTYDGLQQLHYLTMFIEETLRFHPALNFLFRECTKSYNIPNSSLTLEKKTNVYVPVIGIHMDPDLYPEPKLFDPERFTEEQKLKRHKSAYIPFGEGPRICIGMRFAMVQVKLALAGVLAAYEVTTCERTAPPQLDTAGLVTIPKDGVFLRFQKVADLLTL